MFAEAFRRAGPGKISQRQLANIAKTIDATMGTPATGRLNFTAVVDAHPDLVAVRGEGGSRPGLAGAAVGPGWPGTGRDAGFPSGHVRPHVLGGGLPQELGPRGDGSSLRRDCLRLQVDGGVPQGIPGHLRDRAFRRPGWSTRCSFRRPHLSQRRSSSQLSPLARPLSLRPVRMTVHHPGLSRRWRRGSRCRCRRPSFDRCRRRRSPSGSHHPARVATVDEGRRRRATASTSDRWEGPASAGPSGALIGSQVIAGELGDADLLRCVAAVVLVTAPGRR